MGIDWPVPFGLAYQSWDRCISIASAATNELPSLHDFGLLVAAETGVVVRKASTTDESDAADMYEQIAALRSTSAVGIQRYSSSMFASHRAADTLDVAPNAASRFCRSNGGLWSICRNY